MSGKQVMRPIERRVADMQKAGLQPEEIARMFKRSPEHIDRIARLSRLPGRTGASSDRDGLRALERRVLRWRRSGLDHGEIARMFKRSPEHIRRVEGLALYKKSLRLLSAR